MNNKIGGIIPEEEMVGLEDAEREAIRVVRHRARSEVRNVIVETTDLKEIGEIPIFEVSGVMDIVTKPKGILSAEKTEQRYFTVKVHARTGKILACKM